jgi:hypothetical protein
VIAVHVGITRLQMFLTTLTKFNHVEQSPMLSRAFSFSIVDYFTQVLILGGSIAGGGGNRYQGSLLTWLFTRF